MNINFSRAVVTGSEGFIGGHLVDELLSRGVSVLGIDDMSSGLESTLDTHLASDNFVLKPLDIRDQRIASIISTFAPDVIFHLAAKAGVSSSVSDPVFTDLVNVNGSVNILKAAADSSAKRLIFSSSSSVYGGSENLPTKESEPLAPKSPYALQKMMIEEYCGLFSSLYDLDTVSLRYFNVFGERQRADSAYAAVIAAFISAENNNTRPKIYGSGEQFRDFLYVKNAVFANILAANSGEHFCGKVMNIGTGQATTINDLCRRVCSNNPEYHDVRSGDVFCSTADISLAERLISYSPKWSLEEGLLRMLG